MRTSTVIGLAGFVLGSSLLACAAAQDADATGQAGAVSSASFNKDEALSNAAFTDAKSISVEKVQSFLEAYNSPLATYRENEKTAAQIIVDVSKANSLNPLLLLVRAQLERKLIATAPEDLTASSFALAFNCRCQELETCPEKYKGFTSQAKCAGSNFSQSFKAASRPAGTIGGWRVGTTKKTEDGIFVTPKNEATAALYTYVPWVGALAGGSADVAGVSSIAATWQAFAKELGYKLSASPAVGAGSDAGSADASSKTSTAPDASLGNSGDASATTEPGGEPPSGPVTDDEFGTDPDPDGTSTGGPSTGSKDAGTNSPATGDAGATSAESDESPAAIAEGNAPPSSNTPSRGASVGDESTASDLELAARKKSSGGCSSSGGSGGAGSGLLVGLAAALVAAGRRRKSA